MLAVNARAEYPHCRGRAAARRRAAGGRRAASRLPSVATPRQSVVSRYNSAINYDTIKAVVQKQPLNKSHNTIYFFKEHVNGCDR